MAVSQRAQSIITSAAQQQGYNSSQIGGLFSSLNKGSSYKSALTSFGVPSRYSTSVADRVRIVPIASKTSTMLAPRKLNSTAEPAAPKVVVKPTEQILKPEVLKTPTTPIQGMEFMGYDANNQPIWRDTKMYEESQKQKMLDESPWYDKNMNYNPDWTPTSEEEVVNNVSDPYAQAYYISKMKGYDVSKMPISTDAQEKQDELFRQQDQSLLQQQIAEATAKAQKQTREQSASVAATLAQGREGVVSQGNTLTSRNIRATLSGEEQSYVQSINRQMEELKQTQDAQRQQYSASRADRILTLQANIQAQQVALEEAQSKRMDQSLKLLDTMQSSGALANLSEEDIAYLQEGMPGLPGGILQSISNASTREMLSKDQQTQFDNQSKVIGTIKELVGMGIELPPEMMINYAQQTGLPFESIYNFNAAAQQVMQDKNLDNTKKLMEMQKLGYELDRESRGIVTSQLQNVDYLTSLYRNGASQDEISFVKNALGIKDMDDPMYRLEYQSLALKNDAQNIMNAYLPAEKQVSLENQTLEGSIKQLDAFMKGIDAQYYTDEKLMNLKGKDLENYVKQIQADYLPAEKQSALKGAELDAFIKGINAEYLPKEKEQAMAKGELEAYKLGIEAQYLKREKEAMVTGAEYDTYMKGIEAKYLPGEKKVQLEKLLVDMKTQNQEYKSKFGSTAFVPVGGKYTTKTTPNGIELEGVAVDGTETGGQCGRFVNDYTAAKSDPNSFGVMGDKFADKAKWIDESITQGEPGMVFVMPYSWTGHTGVVKRYNPDTKSYTVIDSNWNKDGKILEHDIPASKISGFFVPGNAVSKNVAPAEGGALTGEQATMAGKLYDDYVTMSSEVRFLDQGFAFLDGYNPKTATPASDIALIYAFNKVMDPRSVVREGEFQIASGVGGWLEKIGANINLVTGEGRLTETQRQQIADEMQRIHKTKKAVYKKEFESAAARGKKFGINDPSTFLNYVPEDFDLKTAGGETIIDSYGDYYIPAVKDGVIDYSLSASDLF
jgi:hypothetical protein